MRSTIIHRSKLIIRRHRLRGLYHGSRFFYRGRENTKVKKLA
jgi:hypothetical protein